MPTGPSTTTAPYLIAPGEDVNITSILASGDALPDGGVFAGRADGLVAYDNFDGTITVLVVHNFGSSAGLVHDYGAKGAYIDRLVIDKASLAVVSSDELITSVMRWNDSKDSHYLASGQSLSKFTVADLGALTAYYNSATGLGTSARLLLTGQESGTEGRAYVTTMDGANAGTAWELASLGNMNFQTIVSNPFEQNQTILAITDDSAGGQVYFYIGQKQATGTDLDKAGLMNGGLFGLKVTGLVNETTGAPASGTFTLQEMGVGGDVSNMTGAQIEAESDAEGVTGFLNPEDCVWDPTDPNTLYFTVTGSTTSSRVYKATFNDITNPQAGGTIEALLVGTEGQRTLDSIEYSDGKLILEEDPGSSSRTAKVWEYDLATGDLRQLAYFDPDSFISGGSNFISQKEEASGIIDVTSLFGGTDERVYLLTAQVHLATNDPATVELGQLLLMRVSDHDTETVSFSSGVDTYLRELRPTTNHGSATSLVVDGDADAGRQSLLRFDNLFGNGPGQIPVGAIITSALLTVNSTDGSSPGASFYRMTTDWTSSSTWSSLGDGIQVGVETAASPDLSAASIATGLGSFNVASSINAWLSGASSAAEANAANLGWAIIPNGIDGWTFNSFEGPVAPQLSVTYYLPGGGSTSNVISLSGATRAGMLDTGHSDGNAFISHAREEFGWQLESAQRAPWLHQPLSGHFDGSYFL